MSAWPALTSTADAEFVFACPDCSASLERASLNELRCPVEGTVFERRDGVWRLLARGREAHFATFLQQYQTVRHDEGWGSETRDYYRALPFRDLTGCHRRAWAIRATSYHALLEQVVVPLETERGRALTVLDLGAGCGWLAYRLTQRGHHLAAVDLSTDRLDGLGAYVHFDAAFTPIQAEFDRLPFAPSQADLVVFNGSLHYSTDYRQTLAEALRVLRPDGLIAVLDSPVYHDPNSGAAMVQEREAGFERRYGFAANTISTESYLTFRRLDELGRDLGISWRVVKPPYGLRWALRPWLARLRGRREPATFLVLVGGRDRIKLGTSSRRRLKNGMGRLALRARYHLLQRHRHNQLVLEQVASYPILVLPQVFNPKLLRTGEFFARQLTEKVIPPGSTVLDMGTGSGIGAIAASRWAARVVAVDINPQAVRAARINTLVNRVEDRIDVRQGDLFESVRGERFDVVLFNPPFYRGEPRDPLDHAWRSPDLIERFASGLPEHLTDHGRAVVILSSHGEQAAFLEAFEASGLQRRILAEQEVVNEVLTIYELTVKRQ